MSLVCLWQRIDTDKRGWKKTDTVSCGLQSCIYHLLRQPEEWKRIKNEIDEARKLGRCQSQVVSYEDASKLPRLEAAIKEALRILPPVPSKHRRNILIDCRLIDIFGQWACHGSRQNRALPLGTHIFQKGQHFQ